MEVGLHGAFEQRVTMQVCVALLAALTGLGISACVRTCRACKHSPHAGGWMQLPDASCTTCKHVPRDIMQDSAAAIPVTTPTTTCHVSSPPCRGVRLTLFGFGAASASMGLLVSIPQLIAALGGAANAMPVGDVFQVRAKVVRIVSRFFAAKRIHTHGARGQMARPRSCICVCWRSVARMHNRAHVARTGVLKEGVHGDWGRNAVCST